MKKMRESELLTDEEIQNRCWWESFKFELSSDEKMKESEVILPIKDFRIWIFDWYNSESGLLSDDKIQKWSF